MINRRKTLKVLGASAGMSLLPYSTKAAIDDNPKYIYCLNMSTIRGQNLGFIKELEVASEAGFRSVEIWTGTLEAYLEKGGTLKEAKKRIDDLGLKVENAIGFAQWIVDDETTRKKALEQLKKEMDMLAQIGCHRTAAPPMGAVEQGGLDLKRAGERYRQILEIGEQTGVVPHLELWGFSKNLSKLSEVLYVAAESGHPSARLLLDVYHLYKGKSSIESLTIVGPSSIEIFHVNDYPADKSPEEITDADRIYTGNGVAPISRILKTLQPPNKPLIISFEVFNKEYYTQDALKVASTALAKMKAVTKAI
ncbi:MAG: sugar phosphate isomerase/epimerase [Bacteroidota bacterium]|nr:sugar phosphate isomerase/epimerase [Bacteroidota bacterium]